MQKSLKQSAWAVMQSGLLAAPRRSYYKPGHEPAVFINKDTKVICQGMTGKQVSPRLVSM